MTERTPWAAMLVAACGMRVTPEVFWRLGLREWRAITAPMMGAEHMQRAAFESLARLYPDTVK